MKIFSIGTATLDIFFIFNNLNFFKKNKLLKEKNEVQGYFVDIGGGGLNFAYNFLKLNLKAIAIIKIGNDFIGKVIQHKIQEKKIKCHLIKTQGNSSLSFIFLNGQNGQKYVFTYRGNEIFSLKDIPIDTNSAYYIATGNTPFEIWLKIFNKLKAKSNFIGINPSRFFLENLKKLSYLKDVDFLNMNWEEAKIILGSKKIKNDLDLINQIKNKLNFLKYILITQGIEGAWFIDVFKNKVYHSPIYKKIKVVDTTGAGDSFGSTVYAWLVKNKFLVNDQNIKLALKLATINTAYNLKKIGAQTGLLSLKELQKIAQDVNLKIKTFSL
jgi:sugar/nucleoside kinase (ribokinase family)